MVYSFLASTLDGCECQVHTLAVLPSGKAPPCPEIIAVYSRSKILLL